MLIDLLNSSNYLMINMDAIHIFGLNAAVYCAEILNVYKKAVKKNKIYYDKYFKVDRDYITKQTSLSVEEQLACDQNLIKVDVIDRDPIDADLIYFNVEAYASLLSSEDVKLLNSVSKKVKVDKPKGTKQAARSRIIANLKESIECKTPDILFALNGWIDTIMADPNKYLSNAQVKLFKDKLDDYCNGDLAKALKIIEIATSHAYIDCQWAINLYEKPKFNSNVSNTQIRVTEQKQSIGLGEETF